MSFHNRCIISGANGPITLSVPVEGGRTQRTPFNEVRISNSEKWQRGHWRSILSSYNRSPWFEHYHDGLADLYKTDFTFLIDWDRACTNWTLKCLKADLEIGHPDAFKKSYDGPGIEDLRGKITPKTPGLPEAKSDGKKVIYRQVFEERIGFIPNLSILDLLFCEGSRNAKLLLSENLT